MSRSQSGLGSHLTKAKAPQRESYVIGCQYMYFKTQSPSIQLPREIKRNLSVCKLVTSQRKHTAHARTEQEGSVLRAAQHRLSLTPCPVTDRVGGSLDFCFLPLPLVQLPRGMQQGPILRAFCGDSSCAVWLHPRCRGKCWFSMLSLLLKEDNK